MKFSTCLLVFKVSLRQLVHGISQALQRTPVLSVVPIVILAGVSVIQFQAVGYFRALAGDRSAAQALYRLMSLEQMVVVLSLTLVVIYSAWNDRRSAFLRSLPLSYGESALGWFVLPAVLSGITELVLFAPIMFTVTHSRAGFALALVAVIPVVVAPPLIAFSIAHGSIALRRRLSRTSWRILDVAFSAAGVTLFGVFTALTYAYTIARSLSPLYWVSEVSVAPTPHAFTMLCFDLIAWGLLVGGGVAGAAQLAAPIAIERKARATSRLPTKRVLMFAVLDARQLIRDGQSLMSSAYIAATLAGAVVFLSQVDVPKAQTLAVLTPVAALLISYAALTAVGRDLVAGKYLSVLPIPWTSLQAGKMLVVVAQASIMSSLIAIAMGAFGYVDSWLPLASFYATVLLYTTFAFMFGTVWTVRPSTFAIDDLPPFAVFSLCAYGLVAGANYAIDKAPLGPVSISLSMIILMLAATAVFGGASLHLRKDTVR